jgi:indolepyruvate ferredoxin oxidoreductase beta subunit
VVSATDTGPQLLLSGVGGQGVLTAAKILGDAAHREGLPVVVGQMHGMSQRGGCVSCTVIFGRRRTSFLTGPPDVFVGFEPLEAKRNMHLLGPETRGLISVGCVAPVELTRAGAEYPPVEGLLEEIAGVAPLLRNLDGPTLAEQVGSPGSLNVLLLGALVGLGDLPVSAETLRGAIEGRCSPRSLERNLRAYQAGMAWAEAQSASMSRGAENA